MTLEEEIEALKKEVSELKVVVKTLTDALKVVTEDNVKAKQYIEAVDELISKL